MEREEGNFRLLQPPGIWNVTRSGLGAARRVRWLPGVHDVGGCG